MRSVAPQDAWKVSTLQGTNISHQKWHFEDDFPFPKVGYVSFLEGTFGMPTNRLIQQ